MSRRLVFLLIAYSSVLYAQTPARAGAPTSPSPVSFEQAMARLHTGNDRFATGQADHPDQSPAHRGQLVSGQSPFATVLSCADSRVGPEIVFDQGLGSLFTIRVVGNVASMEDVGSIEYATEHLGVPLVVVMGHTSCGAVKAAIAGGTLEGSLPALIAEVAPAVERVKKENPSLSGVALLNAAVEANVWLQIENLLARSEPIRRAVSQGRVHVVGAVYELDTGKVRWLGAHPLQGKLLGYQPAASTD